jgi:predicted esterase
MRPHKDRSRAALRRLLIECCALSGLAFSGPTLAQAGPAIKGIQDVVALTALVPPSPDSGFHYPYLLRLPEVQTARSPAVLIVEVNNSGEATDDLVVHLKAARRATEQGVGAFAAKWLELPLLVPAFPRPGGDRANIYTHALDRDSLDIESGPMRRLDLQLLAMIDDATQRMRSAGFDVDEQIFMIGFSASATFANRFSMIHPSRVAGLAIGGFNGILMLPQDTVAGMDLLYPLGLADFEVRFGRPFDRDAWAAIPQFAFMGENDTNDAVQFDDAYTDEDRRAIYGAMGEAMQPDRWQFIQRIYTESGAAFRSTTYPGIGHGTNDRINADMATFLAEVVIRETE